MFLMGVGLRSPRSVKVDPAEAGSDRQVRKDSPYRTPLCPRQNRSSVSLLG